MIQDMKKVIILLINLFFMVSVFSQGTKDFNYKMNIKEKVILDTDMVEGFDDGVALLMLENSQNIDLLGVTLVAGNTTMPRACATAIKQVEIIKSDTKIYLGSNLPLSEKRYTSSFFEEEEKAGNKIAYAGFLNILKNKGIEQTIENDPFASYKDVYKYLYNKECTYKNVCSTEKSDSSGCNNAVDFIISQVNKYPNEVILLSIGPLTNIALAIEKDPSLPSKVKKIVYMGGAFYVEGNSTRNAEFNWWVDPDAAKIAINSQWGISKTTSSKEYNNQVIFGLETTNHTNRMPQNIYNKILDNTYDEFRELLIRTKGLESPRQLWDVFAAAYVIDPSIVLSWNNQEIDNTLNNKINGVYIDINTDSLENYAQATVLEKNEINSKSKKAAIANYVDENKFFNEIVYPLLIKK